MRHYRVVRLRRVGSQRRRGSGPVGIARRWESYAAHWWVPPIPILRFRSLRPLGFPRTSSYTSSRKVSSRPFAASGSASLDRSFQVKKKAKDDKKRCARPMGCSPTFEPDVGIAHFDAPVSCIEWSILHPFESILRVERVRPPTWAVC